MVAMAEKRRGRPPARPAEHEPGERSGVQINVRASEQLRDALDAYVAYFNQVNSISTHRNHHVEKAIKKLLAAEGFWDLKKDEFVQPPPA